MTNKRIEIGKVTSCVLSLLLLVAPAALAAYKPPPEQKPAPKDTRSDAGTTRGCGEGEIPPTVLASRNYIGQTSATHPTFAWFVPDSKPLPMKFLLYGFDPDGKPQELYQTSLRTSPGIMTLSPFAEDEPGLEAGKTYLWQVVIFCIPDEPSSALVDRASFEVVPISADVQKDLNQTGDSVKKADVYAEAGLWYDALGEALKLAPGAKLGEVGSNLLQDLAQWETPPKESELSPQERQNLEKRIENLRQIANSAR
jgi:hypothetical protein